MGKGGVNEVRMDPWLWDVDLWPFFSDLKLYLYLLSAFGKVKSEGLEKG